MKGRSMNKFTEINFNDKWPIKLLDHLSIMNVSQWKFWEKERMATMYAAIRPTDVILDIGTCNGDMSAVFAKWVPRGEIILVEPSPDFWPIIRATFEANNLTNFKCYEVLVSNETLEIDNGTERGAWPESSNDEVKLETGFAHLNEKPKIPVMKIDDMKLNHVDVITMDIEGSEYEALQGAQEIIMRDKPILFISVHPEFMWREHHHSPDDLLVMLKLWGYEGTYLAFDHEQHWMFKPMEVES